MPLRKYLSCAPAIVIRTIRGFNIKNPGPKKSANNIVISTVIGFKLFELSQFGLLTCRYKTY